MVWLVATGVTSPPVPMPTRRPGAHDQPWDAAALVAFIASTFWLFLMLMVVALMVRNVNQASHRRQSAHQRGAELQ